MWFHYRLCKKSMQLFAVLVLFQVHQVLRV